MWSYYFNTLPLKVWRSVRFFFFYKWIFIKDASNWSIVTAEIGHCKKYLYISKSWFPQNIKQHSILSDFWRIMWHWSHSVILYLYIQNLSIVIYVYIQLSICILLFLIYLYFFIIFFIICVFCSVTVILLHCGSFCHENQFLVCVNIPGNKAHSDSDSEDWSYWCDWLNSAFLSQE